jgi:hypothetical protein
MTREARVQRYIQILNSNGEANSSTNWGFLDALTDEDLFNEEKIAECMTKIRHGMHNRYYVYAFKNANGAVSVVNYSADNPKVNNFLSAFDVWGSCGQKKVSIDKYNDICYAERWFECDEDFWDMLHNPIFNRAFKGLGMTLTFEYPYTV